MVKVILICVLVLATLIFSMLLRHYSEVPVKELKRRARSGRRPDLLNYELAKNRVVLLFYLRLITAITSIWATVLISFYLEALWTGFTLLFIFILFLLVVKYRPFSVFLSLRFAPLFIKLTQKTKSKVGPIANFTNKYFMSYQEQKLYELEDLTELISSQTKKPYNRIDSSKLMLVESVLRFDEKKVSGLMRTTKETRFVNGEDAISTVLIDELHKTGQRHFPVYKDKKSNLIGVLDLDTLVEKKMSGKIAWAVEAEVVYVDQDDNLYIVLEKFIDHKNQLFIVKDDTDKIIGSLSVDNLLAELLAQET